MHQRGFILACLTVGLGLVPSAIRAEVIETVNLSDALTEAISANPVLAAATYDSTVDQFLVKEARADLFPEISAIGGYSRYEEPNIVLPIHEAGVFPPLDDDIYEGRIELHVPLFDGGRRRALVEATEASATSTSARADVTRMEIVAGVSRLFLEASRVEAGAVLVSARLVVLRQRHREIQTLMNEGRASSADLSLVEASLAEVVADSLELDSQRIEISLRLALWLGSDTPVKPVVTAAVDATGSVSFLEAVPVEAAPRIREAEGRLEQASARYAAAAKAYWPELTGFAAVLSRSGDDLDFTSEWSAGVAVRMPLFTGGRRSASKKAAAAARMAAERRYLAVQLELQTNERAAIARWRSANSRQAALSQAAENKFISVSAQRELQAAGRLTLAELLTQETELLNMQLKAADMALAARFALLDYHIAIGTLSPAYAQAIVERKP